MNTPIINPDSVFRIHDDFTTLNTALWTSVDDGATGTNLLNDTFEGEVSVVTAGADNDYHVMVSKKLFKFLAGKPLRFEARFSLTEANTDDANIILGLTSVTTNGNLQSDGAGPATSYDGALFFKVDGGTALQFETSAGSTQITNTNISAFTSGNVYRVGFQFDPGDGVTGLITPYVYNETTGKLVNTDGKSSQGLIHRIPLAGLGNMAVVYGVKAGGSSAETIKMLEIDCFQAR